MSFEVVLDLFSLMPWRSIDVNPNSETLEPVAYVFQNTQKPLTVPFGGSNQSSPAQKWSDPTRKIQTSSMLACRRNPKWLTSFGPSSAQPRMEAKTCLILKNDGLLELKVSKFFLTTYENAWHPQNGPEGRHSWHASSDSPADASSTGLVEPSNSPQNTSLSGQPVSDHPIRYGAPPKLTRTLL